MKYALRKLVFPFLSALSVISAAAQQHPTGIFSGSQDIGTGTKHGAARYAPATQQYVVTETGRSSRDDHDEGHFVYKKIKGDFLLYARTGFEGKDGADPHRQLGWMVRQSLVGNSAQVRAVTHGDGLTALQYNRTGSGAAEEIRANVSHANVLQLERKGTTYTLRAAVFGQPFATQQVANIDLGSEVYVGLFVGSRRADTPSTGVFRDVRISVPVPEGPEPFRGYLGSQVELLDVASGRREIMYSSPKSLQAPNWRLDGKSLLYNSEGQIFTLDLATRRPALLPTGVVQNNNNDHVLSFDGQRLGLSSGVEELGGSIIYTVPSGGGTPQQVTPRGPSYLHGWSPDGQSLVFTGQRNGEFDIYRVPAAGGPEVRLTSAPGLDDGPEYTPDGRYIYFNSNRTGTMQVWRMQADGSRQEAVTTGDFQDWFPHISPDGKWIVFLSFLKEEVPAGDHPFYKHVYLRLLPIAGGQPRVIAYLYGGQGSINTPSWSPDSKRLAFVSNTAVLISP